MIWRTDGAGSTYYAGLNLAFIAACQLLPYRFIDSILFSLILVASYLVSCIAHPNGLSPVGEFYNNLYFIVLTGIICVTTTFFFEKRRLTDFKLRYELSLRNEQLSQLDKLKSQFFANVSHELRTPLTLILSPVENLLQSGSQVKQKSNAALS
ncbi:MAG: histidine kinase dimerization/phospho-acceptor domain-containing protein [Pirellulaceae bacterium]